MQEPVYKPVLEEIQYLYGVVPVLVSQLEGCGTCFRFSMHDDWNNECTVACGVFDGIVTSGTEPPSWTEDFNAGHPALKNLTSEQINMLKELKP